MADNLSFPSFELRPTERVLLVDGQVTPVGARAFDVLTFLATNRHRVVSKDEVLDHVWPGVAVEDGNLTVQISALRKLLGKGVISTVTGFGYQFTPPGDAAAPKLSEGPPLPDKPSLAVLPFANLSGDPSQEYFIDGVVGDIINGLSRVRAFFVIAQSSSFTYKGRNVSVGEVGRELGVRYALEGSFQQAGQILRVRTQLVEAATGRAIWSARFDGARDDVFALQDEITESVVAAIEPKLVMAEIERAQAKPTDSLQAYDLCLQALPLALTSFSLPVFEEALRLLSLAIEADPGYSYSKAIYAYAHLVVASNRLISHDREKAAISYAELALENHMDDPATLAYAGVALAFLGRKFDPAMDALDHALLLSPNSTIALRNAGYVRMYRAEPDQAIAHFQRSMRLNALDPQIAVDQTGLGLALMQKQQYAEAEVYFRRSLAGMPGFQTASRGLMQCYFKLGHMDSLQEVGDRLRSAHPDLTLAAVRDSNPTVKREFVEEMCDALRAAGFPEA